MLDNSKIVHALIGCLSKKVGTIIEHKNDQYMVLKFDHEISRSHSQFVYKDFFQDLSLNSRFINNFEKVPFVKHFIK